MSLQNVFFFNMDLYSSKIMITIQIMINGWELLEASE